jgi:hypothetical protein
MSFNDAAIVDYTAGSIKAVFASVCLSEYVRDLGSVSNKGLALKAVGNLF